MDMKEAQTSQAKTMVVDDLQENRKAARKKRSPFSIIFEVLLYVAIIVFCIFVVPTYILQRTVVDGNSMQDTLQNGDSLLVNKFIYRIHDPERYDIIVFYPKGHDVDEYYVKRIYGLPGETVYIDNNSIYINGKKIDDPYAKDAMDDSQIELGTKEKPYTLKSDEYYVLGDHRSVSLDSRSIPQGEDPDAPGPVKRENIAGKVFLRIWPLNQFGDSLLVNKFIYRIHDPERYDIIVFYPKGHDVDEYYVKRIYGLPGETVYIDNNSIYINGKKIDDPYAKDAMDDSQIELGTKEKPYTLKSDEYYVLGDHRSVSLDSRSIPQGEDPDAPGPVKRENIAGKVFLRIWPLNQFGKP